MKKLCYYVVKVGDQIACASLKYHYAWCLYHVLDKMYPDVHSCIMERDSIPDEVLIL